MRFPAILAAALVLLVSCRTAPGQSYVISTFAGGALPVNVPGTTASLFGPQTAMAFDASGNLFFVDGNTVLRLDAASGLLTLVAGNGTAGYSGDNGPAVTAQLHDPYGIALDAAGNLYIACLDDNVVRKVSGGVITTVAGTGTPGFSGDGGPAASARLNEPYGIALDAAGNLYIADYGNNRVREISGGVITTVAGSGTAGYSGDLGPATSAQLSGPHSVAIDASGNLYIADSGNNRIRMVSGGAISTVAGNGAAGFFGDNGPATAAQLFLPCGIALDGAGNLYIADYYNNRIREISAGVITTAAGTGVPGFGGDGGAAANAQLDTPFAVAIAPGGDLYLADYGNDRIRKVSGGVIATVAGSANAGFSGDNGLAISAQLRYPSGVAADASGNLYIADTGNNRVRKVSDGVITTAAGTGAAGFGGDGGAPGAAQLDQPSGVALDASGALYIADSGNNRVRKAAGGTISTAAGNGTAGYGGDGGPALSAELSAPSGIALDGSGNLYIADTGNNRIRKVTGGTIATVAGNGTAGFSGDGGQASNAELSAPSGVALDGSGNLYIADTGNNRIRRVSGGVIATVAGNGVAGFGGDGAAAASAQLYAPGGVLSGSNGAFFIADTSNNVIRRVSSGAIATVGGGGGSFGDNGPATGGELANPQALAADSAGNLYVADTQNNRIRMLAPVPLAITGPSSLPAGTTNAAYSGATFTAAGGAGGYTWSATGLPKGMTLSAAGLLSGTPVAAATSTLQITVKDSASASASESLALVVANPIPVVTALSPASATANGAAFTLTVTGSGFLTGAAVLWNNSPLTTKVVSGTQLTAPVAAGLIAAVGTVQVAVSSGGGTSNAMTFSVNAPTPVLSSLTPASAVATTSGFTLTAAGTGFVTSTVLEWNGTPLPTTFISATQLSASVSAALIAGAGSAAVTANSGGASSKAISFVINPPPAITGLSPSSATAYSAAFTLTVTGSGFASGATVEWNGATLTTKVVSATQLTASVPASLIGGAGSVSVLVLSGGILSAAAAFTINPQPPSLTSLNPASVVAGGSAFTLTVNGSGFTTGTVVQLNGAALPTSFVSANQLTAYVAASLIASAGNASVGVVAGGTSSGTLTLAVSAPPAIASLSPASAVTGTGAFTLTVSGTGFAAGSVVQWNGAPLGTTFVSSTQLKAAVPAGLIANPASVTILVSLGGASSAGVTFAVNGPPVVTSVSPASALAGGAGFTLTVNGTGFTAGAVIDWNGTPLTTKVVSPVQLTGAVTASMIAAAGSVNVVVAVSGALSAVVAFPVEAPPIVTGLNPASVAANGAAFTLTVNGTGFQSGAAVEWNGAALATTFVSSTQLTAAVPVNLAAAAGTASIVVSSGSVSTAAAKLTLTAAPPVIPAGGVVPIYSAATVIQPGSWVSIYGTALANGTYLWSGNFPTTLGGTSVTIDGKAAYLWSVSPTQINLQAPADTVTGNVSVVVRTGSGSTTATVALAQYGPSFSLFSGTPYAAGVIPTPAGTGAYGGGAYDLAGPAGTFSFTTRPVNPGETLELFGVGFGPTNPAVAPGKAFSGAAPATGAVTVTIGGLPAQVLFCGMTEAGVFQINVVVPNVPAGDQGLQASAGGVSTPGGVLITVQ